MAQGRGHRAYTRRARSGKVSLVARKDGAKANTENTFEAKYYAIANSIWPRVAPKKRAKYLKLARARYKKDKAQWPEHGHAKQAPREFVYRIATGNHPEGYKSLIAEFPEAADMLKAAFPDMAKAVEAEMHKSDPWDHTSGSPTMTTPHGSYLIQKKTTGSTTTHKLSFTPGPQHKGMVVSSKHFPSEKAAKQAAGVHALSLHDKFKKKSTENAMKKSFDTLVKSLGSENTVLGHTASGKAVKSKGDYHSGFTIEDHEDAAEIHSDLASKLEGAGSRWAAGNKLGPASRRMLEQYAKEHRQQSQAHSNASYKMRSASAKPTEAAGIVSNDKFASTEEDLHKAIEAEFGKAYVNPKSGKRYTTSPRKAQGFSDMAHQWTKNAKATGGHVGDHTTAAKQHLVAAFYQHHAGNSVAAKQHYKQAMVHHAQAAKLGGGTTRHTMTRHQHEWTESHRAATAKLIGVKKGIEMADLAKSLSTLVDEAVSDILADRKTRCCACNTEQHASFTSNHETLKAVCICDKPIVKSALALRVADKVKSSTDDVIKQALSLGLPLAGPEVEQFIEEVNTEE